MEVALWYAAKEGSLEDIKKILETSLNRIILDNHKQQQQKKKEDPIKPSNVTSPTKAGAANGATELIDINSPNNFFPEKQSPLHVACSMGRTSVVKLFLEDPRIRVNKRDKNGHTSLMGACQNGELEVVKLLVQDLRVEIDAHNQANETALHMAFEGNHLEILKWLLVSKGTTEVTDHEGICFGSRFDNYGKGEDTGAVMAGNGIAPNNTRLKIVKNILAEYQEDKSRDCSPSDDPKIKLQMVDLLKRFENDQVNTLIRLRLELGLADALAAETFALIVMLSDDYLKTKRENRKNRNIIRFLKITVALPQEIQMLICNRFMKFLMI